MRAAGVAGTAKNTGKTTTSLEMIRQSVEAGLRVALTSIGYDGEDRDNITGLPKPRYLLPKGTYVATAERCLRAASDGYKILFETTVSTVLGPVVVAQIVRPTLVVIAGPNTRRDLAVVLDLFAGLGIDLAIVDGALNRLVPLIGTDGLVLATGAALDERIPVVAEHAQALADLFVPPVAADRAAWGRRIEVRPEAGGAVQLEMSSLLSEDTALEIYRLAVSRVRDLVVPGACDPGLMGRLLDHGASALGEARLVLGSPLKLIASGEVRRWSRLLAEARARGQVVEYLEKIPVLFMTVNPFYPRYQPAQGTYVPGAVDKAGLLASVRAHVPDIPVFDIKQPPVPDMPALLQAIDRPLPAAAVRIGPGVEYATGGQRPEAGGGDKGDES